MNPLRDRLSRLVGVRPGEARAVALSALYFFCLLSSYYMLRPIRETMGVAGGVRNLPWLYMGTLGAMLAAQPLFGLLTSRTPRKVFIPATYHFFALNMLVFAWLLSRRAEGSLWEARAFYVWTSVFNLFVVSVFWGFMADIWRAEQGKRLFALIGIGGTLGAILGAGATGMMAERLGLVWSLIVAACVLECAVVCVLVLRRLPLTSADGASASGAPADTPGAERPLSRGGVFGGVWDVLRSPYLLGVSLFMLLFTVSSTFVYFEQARIVAGAFKDTASRTAAFARIDLYVNIATLLLQAAVTGRLMRAVGVGRTLVLLPALTVVGFFALAAWPAFATLAAFQVLRRATDYGLTRPARETLYTVVSREEKYKAKSFIDTFVYRGGDAIGAWSSAGLTALGVGALGLAGVFAPLGIVWGAIALWLGSQQRRRAESQASNGGAGAPALMASRA